MRTLDTILADHGQDVFEHLDRQITVPICDGLQRQGDIIVIPDTTAAPVKQLPKAGYPVVRGENGANTHSLHGDGAVFWEAHDADSADLTRGKLTVPAGSTAYLIHPEHGACGIAPGSYRIGRQREQADEIRMVQD